MRRRILAAAGLVLMASALPVFGQGAEVDGVLGVYPVGERTCLAVEAQLGKGQALLGVRWFNNDGTRVFSEVVVAAGQAGVPAALQGTEFGIHDVVGATSAWSEVALPSPVVSPTGVVFVSFVLPAGGLRTGVGSGGGPGIGYWRKGGGPPAYISADGVEWVAVHPDCSLALEPVVGPAPADALVLPTGSTRTLSAGASAVVMAQPRVSETTLLPVHPNPFNPATEIRFTLAHAAMVDLVIFNLRGQRVRLLLHQELDVGDHTVTWRGGDDTGAAVASGAYIVRMVVDGQKVLTQRLAMVR